MTTFRPDTSFPFLKIAREFGTNYATVLRIAEAIEAGYDYARQPMHIAIAVAVAVERHRRLNVTGPQL